MEGERSELPLREETYVPPESHKASEPKASYLKARRHTRSGPRRERDDQGPAEMCVSLQVYTRRIRCRLSFMREDIPSTPQIFKHEPQDQHDISVLAEYLFRLHVCNFGEDALARFDELLKAEGFEAPVPYEAPQTIEEVIVLRNKYNAQTQRSFLALGRAFQAILPELKPEPEIPPRTSKPGRLVVTRRPEGAPVPDEASVAKALEDHRKIMDAMFGDQGPGDEPPKGGFFVEVSSPREATRPG